MGDQKNRVSTVPPPSKDGVRTRFDAETEHHLRQQAKREGYGSIQDYLRELARRDKVANREPKKP